MAARWPRLRRGRGCGACASACSARTRPRDFGTRTGFGPNAHPRPSGRCDWDAELAGLRGMTARSVWETPVRYSLNEADLLLNELVTEVLLNMPIER